MMLYFYMEETDPFFCLAAEEFFLKNYEEDLFMVWQSHNVVVVGKHQNALAEINYRYVRENGIKVARRISGGGTVFHDRGNINFTFIRNVRGPQEVNFQQFLDPIMEALAEIGIYAVLSGRHDLLVRGKKISGNAQHLFKNRVLHHGTLLFESDLNQLGSALSSGPGKYTGKAVESRPSEVANISPFLRKPLPREEFIHTLLNYQLKTNPHARNFRIPLSDKEKIRNLSRQKFETPEWQYGYSPPYVFCNTTSVENRELSVSLNVEKGVIKKAGLSGNFYHANEAKTLETLLVGKYHLFDTVLSAHRALETDIDEKIIYQYF
jgi:lipoate-protein ligase A